MLPSWGAPQWITFGVYARIHWSNPSGKQTPDPNPNRLSACTACGESGITCHWIWSLNTPCRWHLHPQICNFFPLKRERCFLDWNCCCYLHMQAETRHWVWSQGLAELLWPCLEMNLPLLALLGSAFPPTMFWSCLSLSFPQLLSTERALTHSAASQQASPQSLHALGISQNIGSFPPWAAPL